MLLLHPALVLFLAIAGSGPDPLASLNAAFSEAYGQAKAAARAGSGPVLLLAGDCLALYRDGVRAAEAQVRPPFYHQLKRVDHVPLALRLLLADPGRPLPPARLEALGEQVRAARAGLAGWCPAGLRERQERILDACAVLLEEANRPARLAPGRLDRFAAELGPLLLANAGEAAARELDALDRAAAGFRKALGPQAWRSVQVVILGAHMPRNQDLALQYFTWLLGEPGEGGRVIYSEGLGEPEQGLDLLATHRVDGGLGGAFFGDPARMHRDVLADGARRWLEQRAKAD